MRRMAMKRPYDSRSGREEFYTEAKRPAVTDTRFTSNSTFTSDRYMYECDHSGLTNNA